MIRQLRWRSKGVYGDLFSNDPATIAGFNAQASNEGLDTRMCTKCGWQTLALCRQADGGAPGWHDGECGPCRDTEWVFRSECSERSYLARSSGSRGASPADSLAVQGKDVPGSLDVIGWGVAMRLATSQDRGVSAEQAPNPTDRNNPDVSL